MATRRRAEGEQVYKMSSSYIRGLVLIVNNFSEHRVGSKNDVELMKNMWIDFGFLPFCHKDLNAQDMEATIQRFCRKPHLKFVDSLVVMLMSHGEGDGINGYTESNQPRNKLLYTTIFEMFNDVNCKVMEGKPKLIFIQACRGGERDGVHVDLTVTPSSSPDDYEEVEPDFSQLVLNDTYIAYSTTKGYFSMRDSTGTVFIKAIEEVFRKEADKDDFLHLMIKVKQNVSNCRKVFGGRPIMQQPVLDSFLSNKKLYLR